MSDYATKEDLEEKCKEINGKIDNIMNNHLPHILSLIEMVKDRVMTNRWVFLGSVAVLGVALGIRDVFG